jgi:hypothetical protein
MQKDHVVATKIENLSLEVAHFNHFKQFIPAAELWCEDTVQHFLSMGMVQVSTAFEQALARVGNHEIVSHDCGDLYRNGVYSDAKLSTVRTGAYGKSYAAGVTKIHNKVGDLRVQVFERKQNQFYYFVIPKNAYTHIPKTSNIEIPFELDGSPRITPKRPVIVNWWQFRVPTWQELARK